MLLREFGFATCRLRVERPTVNSIKKLAHSIVGHVTGARDFGHKSRFVKASNIALLNFDEFRRGSAYVLLYDLSFVFPA